MKYTIQYYNNRLVNAEECINHLEDRIMQSNHTEWQKENNFYLFFKILFYSNSINQHVVCH